MPERQGTYEIVIAVQTRKRWLRKARTVQKTIVLHTAERVGSIRTSRNPHDGSLRVYLAFWGIVMTGEEVTTAIGMREADFPEIRFTDITEVNVHWTPPGLTAQTR